jgi:hypothetical protein
MLTLEQVRRMQEQSDEKVLSLFLADTNCIEYSRSFAELSHIFSSEFQQTCHPDITQLYTLSLASSEKEETTELVEISPGKPLYINSSLEPEQKTQVIEMLQRQFDAFAWDYADMKGIHPDTCTHHIYTNDQIRPVRQPQRRMNPTLKDIVKEELQKLLQANLIYPISDSQWVSPLVIVPKKNDKWRICVDFQELNKATHRDYFPLPFIDQVLDTLSRKKYFSFLDGFSGYNQIQIAPEDQEKATFTCPWGTYTYRVLPFGLCNAPTTFQRVFLAIFSDLTNDCMEVYMDDFIVHGQDFQEALTSLEKVLIRCKETNLSLRNEKSKMMLTEGIVLGHHISGSGMRVDPAKIYIITQIRIPSSQKEVHSFLGHVGYYRRFIPNFTSLATPLFKLLSKEAEFKWDDECQISFEILKQKLSTTPILRGPNWSLPFHICTDASDTALGAVLGQRENQMPYVIYFVSKNLSPTEVNYTVIEKELLAIVHAINKFRHYITGYQAFVHTDHSTIKFLMNKPVTNPRVTRWLLLLQEFNINIIDRPGKDNLMANFLSRMIHLGDNAPVEDNFPDENLFAISTFTPWYADVANYLVTGKMPQKLSPREKQKVIQLSANYMWHDDCLYKTGPDLVIRRCVREDEIHDILQACHDGPCGGHFADKRTAYKVLQSGYYWPHIFRDAKTYVSNCDECQRMGKPTA